MKPVVFRQAVLRKLLADPTVVEAMNKASDYVGAVRVLVAEAKRRGVRVVEAKP